MPLGVTLTLGALGFVVEAVPEATVGTASDSDDGGRTVLEDEPGVAPVDAPSDVDTDTDIAAIQADGRAVHLSVRPTRRNGTPIAWIDIANAEAGSSLHDEMVAWADAVVTLGPDLRFTFNHEPETNDSAPSGNALEYRAAWRRMVELIRAQGGDHTTMVWTVGREAVTSVGDGSPWYPGDDVVDGCVDEVRRHLLRRLCVDVTHSDSERQAIEAQSPRRCGRLTGEALTDDGDRRNTC